MSLTGKSIWATRGTSTDLVHNLSQANSIYHRYYQAYVSFFSGLLLSKPNTMASVLEDYVLSKDANVVPAKNGSKPLMLSRFLGGFLHPLIHVGYGAEFGLPGMISEGLSSRCHVAFMLKYF